MDPDKTSILNILDGIEFFSGFSKDELSIILETGEWFKIATNKRIVTKGELDLYMYVIIQGFVEVIFDDKILSKLKSGDVFGEFGLMGNRRTATVESRSECLLLGFNAEHLNRLPLEVQVKFLRRVIDIIFLRLQKINRECWLRLPNKSKCTQSHK